MWIAVIFFFSTEYGSRGGGRAVHTQEFSSQEACLSAKSMLESQKYYDGDKVIVHCVRKYL